MWKYIFMAAASLLKNSISLTVTSNGRSTVTGENGRTTEFDSDVLSKTGSTSEETISYSSTYTNAEQPSEIKSVLGIVSDMKLNNEIANDDLNLSTLDLHNEQKINYITQMRSLRAIEDETEVFDTSDFSRKFIENISKELSTHKIRNISETITNTLRPEKISSYYISQNSSIFNIVDSKSKYPTSIFSTIENEENFVSVAPEMLDVEQLQKEEFTVQYLIEDLASFRSEALDYIYLDTDFIGKNDELITPTKVLIDAEDLKLASKNNFTVASAFQSHILNYTISNMITTLSNDVLNKNQMKSLQITRFDNYTKSYSMLNDTLSLELSFHADTIMFQSSLSSKSSITSSIKVDDFHTQHKLYSIEKVYSSEVELSSSKMHIDAPFSSKTETSSMDPYYEVTSRNVIEMSTEFPVHETVYKNSPELGIFDIFSNNKSVLANHSSLHKQYIFIVRKSCNHNNSITHIFELSNSTLCDNFLEENSTKLVKCESFNELYSSTNAASDVSFKEALKLINVDSFGALQVNRVHSNTSTFKIILLNENNASCSAFHVSNNTAYMTAATSLLLFVLSLIGLCIWTKCRRKSTSLDLSNIPHLTLSVDDYKLAPIPRPSISLSENNENISQAYSNETYSRRKPSDTILNHHHFYSNTAKTYIVPGVGKEIPINQELHTFTGKRSNCRNKKPGCQTIHQL